MKKKKETREEKDGKKRKKNSHSAPIGTFANSGKLPVWIACASPNAAERWLMALPQVLQNMRVTICACEYISQESAGGEERARMRRNESAGTTKRKPRRPTKLAAAGNTLNFKERDDSNAPIFPDAALTLYSPTGPAIVTSFCGARTFVLNALPLVCLQSVQWHMICVVLSAHHDHIASDD
jgi:hypothetical protein